MSELLIVTSPTLVTGFRLAGVNAFAAADAQEAQALIGRWLNEEESGLLAVDEELLAALDPAFVQRMAAAEQLPYLALPSGRATGPEHSGHSRIVELLRQAIGFQISFRGEP
jgi:vacuolar-type H+-ATPase subunit F/Vma7